MKKIQILGPGCQKCRVLYEHTKAATEQLGLECTIEKVHAGNPMIKII